MCASEGVELVRSVHLSPLHRLLGDWSISGVFYIITFFDFTDWCVLILPSPCCVMRSHRTRRSHLPLRFGLAWGVLRWDLSRWYLLVLGCYYVFFGVGNTRW